MLCNMLINTKQKHVMHVIFSSHCKAHFMPCEAPTQEPKSNLTSGLGRKGVPVVDTRVCCPQAHAIDVQGRVVVRTKKLVFVVGW